MSGSIIPPEGGNHRKVMKTCRHDEDAARGTTLKMHTKVLKTERYQMNSEPRILVARRPKVLVFGLVAILAVVAAMGYAATASAQSNSSSGCSVTSMGRIASDGRDSAVGDWEQSCSSQNRTGRYARFYSFRVGETSDVRIDLRSTDDPEVDTYLYLISGSSKTGAVIQQDDNRGDGYNSRITRRLSAGTYTVEATTSGSAKTGGFSVSVEVSKPVANATSRSVFLRQQVSLWATVPRSKGAVSGYQWQRWGGSDWVNEGSSSTSYLRTVSWSAPGIHTYRVVVSYRGGGTGTSVPISVEWVKLAQLTHTPEYPDVGDSVTLTVDVLDGPSKVSYQWQELKDSKWTNLGSATTSRSKVVSQLGRGAVEYRVVASYLAGRAVVTDTSDSLSVIWGDWRIAKDLAGELNVALFGGQSGGGGIVGQAATNGNPLVTEAQSKFLDCLNKDRTGNDRFDGFYAVVKSYAGEVATKVDDCEDALPESKRMFSALKSGAAAELKKLGAKSDEYGDYLSTDRGQTFAAGFAVEAALKLLGNVLATDFEAPSGTGMDCVPSSEPSTLPKKIGAVNCLVFRTPHGFWVSISDDDARTLDRTRWLGVGNWQCDAVFDGALPSCRKHDVAFGSLQKFVGTDSADELDRTWNPRNKALADAKFWADIVEHGCDSGDIEEFTCGIGGYATKVTGHFYHTGVSDANNKGWPVTTEDLDDARAHRSRSSTSDSATGSVSSHSFIDCEDEVPTVEDVTVKRDRNDDDFSVEWDHVDGCVDEIVIGRIGAWLAIEFDNGEVGYDSVENLVGTATSATFDLSRWQDLEPVGGLFEVYLYPENRVYGGESYIHEFTIDEVE